MARTIDEERVEDEVDAELLPGGPEPSVDDDEDPTNQVLARLDQATPPEGVSNSDAWVEPSTNGTNATEPSEPPKPRRKRSRRLPPSNLDEAVVKLPVHMRLISLGKGIANVTATLGFDLDHSVRDLAELMGEHAYAAVFDGNYVGNGVFLKDAPLSVDVENHVNQKLKVNLPRYADGADQITKYITPLLPEDVDLESLLGLSLSWRLNVNVDFPGTLALHAMQQSFSLTQRAEDTSDGVTYERA